MKLIGACSEPSYTNGIVKALVTIYWDGNPEYVWINVKREHIDFDLKKKIRVTIENEEE